MSDPDQSEPNPSGAQSQRTEHNRVRLSAMNMLARREHSRKELQNKLCSRFDSDTVVAVLDELIADGLQSDQRFLERFVSSKVNSGQGPKKIAYDLRSKGIAAEMVAEQLQGYDDDWLEMARELVRRKYGDIGDLLEQDYKQRQKIQRFIASRGFSNDICYKLFKCSDFD